MKAITNTQQENIFGFLNNLSTEICITEYVNIEDVDFENAFESIYDTIQDNNGFNIDIIYYSNAIEYLKENDNSLNESIEIALEYGYELKNINSELLASLLASRNAQENFYELRNEIENYFSELVTELED